MTETTDSRSIAALLTAARAGDHGAFAVLIHWYYPMVRAECTVLSARTLVQASYDRAWSLDIQSALGAHRRTSLQRHRRLRWLP